MGDKEELKRARSRERKEKTLEMLKNKKSISQVSNELQVSTATVLRYIRELIQEERITEDEIYKTPRGVRNQKIDRNNEEYILIRSEIIKYLKMGWSTKAISKELNVTSYYMNIFMREITTKRFMTSAEISEDRARKKEEDLELLVKIVNEGLTVKHYGELRPELSVQTIASYIKELIDAGRISREQIDENFKKSISKARLASMPMTIEEQKAFIIDKLNKGYSIPEIIEADTTGTLTRERVIKRRNELIAAGLVTEKDIQKFKNARQKSMIVEKHDELIGIIMNYVRQGFDFAEIAIILECSKSYIYKLKTAYTRDHSWFTEEEIEEFKSKRKLDAYEDLPVDAKARLLEAKKQEEEEAEESRKIRTANRQARVNQTQQKHQEDIEIIKKYLLLGYEYSEIGKILEKSVEYVYKLKYESMGSATWLTDSEIEMAEKRKLRRREKQAQKIQAIKEQEKERRIQERKESEEKIKLDTLLTLRELTTQGLSTSEIARYNALF